MSKQQKTNFWLELLDQLVAVFFKSAHTNARGRTFHQHVVPHEKGWAVRREGNKRVTATYKYQDPAIRKAKRIAKKYKADVIVHRSDGTIRDRMGYE